MLIQQIGDTLSWRSQAGGRWKEKTGEVIGIVEADQTVGAALANARLKANSPASPDYTKKFVSHPIRNHEGRRATQSYLVAVPHATKPNKFVIYWPHNRSLLVNTNTTPATT